MNFFAVKPPPPVEVDSMAFPDLDLAGFNADRFFPSDARRILVDRDADALGLFSRTQGAIFPVANRWYASPEG
jgi:hypothetical protein